MNHPADNNTSSNKQSARAFPENLIQPFTWLIMLCTLSLSTVAEVYKWVDEDGRIHYGDKPGNQSSKVINIKENRAASQVDIQRESRRQRLLEVMAEERQNKQTEKAEASKLAKTKAMNCDRARKQLVTIENSSYLMEKTADPYNPKILTDIERLAATNDARKAVSHWCSR